MSASGDWPCARLSCPQTAVGPPPKAAATISQFTIGGRVEVEEKEERGGAEGSELEADGWEADGWEADSSESCLSITTRSLKEGLSSALTVRQASTILL